MPETPVSRAYKNLESILGPIFTDAALDDTKRQGATLDAVYNQLAGVWSDTQRNTRAEIARELDELADARMEYVVLPRASGPKNLEDVLKLPGAGPIIFGEATGARTLARIIAGDKAARLGWLPSWRWQDT